LPGFSDLYTRLGLVFSPSAQQTILDASSSENPAQLAQGKTHSVRLDSRTNLHNWKKHLSPTEIARLRRQVEETAAIYYPDADWGDV
jgi:hypothetical protein